MDAQTLQNAIGCTSENAAKFADPITEAMAEFDILTECQQAAFLAQIGHESGRLKYTRELWGPTPAQARYEGRSDLGNDEPGDGFKYRGMGLIQTTGKANQRRVAEYFGIPFEQIGEWLQSPEGAARSAALFWSEHGCNHYVEANDFQGLTKRINGGLNGLDDRLALWERAKKVLLCSQ